jgi:hypothetical protein
MALGNRPKMSSPHTTNDHEGGIICSVYLDVWICVDLFGMKLAHLAYLYQLNDILKGFRPVEAMPEGFTNQRAR